MERIERATPLPEAFASDRSCFALSKGLESFKTAVRKVYKTEEAAAKKEGRVPDDPYEQRLSNWCIEFDLHRGVLDDRGLSVTDVEQALRNYLRGDSLVTSMGSTNPSWKIRCRLRGVAALAVAAEVTDSKQITVIEQRVSDMVRSHLMETVLVHGHPLVAYAVAKKRPRFGISLEDSSLSDTSEFVVETVGADLQDFVAMPGVDGARTEVTSVVDIQQRLGIEAARTMLLRRFRAIFGDQRVDDRHIQHLVQVMTHIGSITPLTRHKMRSLGAGVLARAAFEMTSARLHAAAVATAVDPKRCVPSNVILGQMSMRIGTGSVVTRTDPTYEKMMLRLRRGLPTVEEKDEEADAEDEILPPLEVKSLPKRIQRSLEDLVFVGDPLPSQLGGSSLGLQAIQRSGDSDSDDDEDEDEEAKDMETVDAIDIDRIEHEVRVKQERISAVGSGRDPDEAEEFLAPLIERSSGAVETFIPPNLQTTADLPAGLVKAMLRVQTIVREMR